MRKFVTNDGSDEFLPNFDTWPNKKGKIILGRIKYHKKHTNPSLQFRKFNIYSFFDYWIDNFSDKILKIQNLTWSKILLL